MLFLLTIALVAASAWGFTQPDANSDKRSAAQQLLQQTLAARPSLSLEEYIRQLQRVASLDGKSAEAFHALGCAYIEQGTIAGRNRAESAWARAIQLAPRNTEYRYAMAKLQLQRGATGAAKSEFNKIKKIDPLDARPYYHLALFKEEDMLHYRDLISPHENATFYFYDFAQKDFVEAERLLRSAIGLDPAMTAAYHHLAGLYFDAQLYEKMAALLEKATARIASADLFLFLGLARQQLGNADAAQQAYDRAQQLMPPESRAFFHSLQIVLAPDSAKSYENAPDSLKAKTQRRFWERRDPLFLTAANERLLEHFGRIAYANLRYGVPEKNIPGWKTDRGQTLIRFGHPRWRVRTRAEIGASATGRAALNASKEFWDYGAFQMIFDDRFLNRNYSFAWGSVGEIDGKWLFERKIRELPERFEFPHGGRRLELPHIIAQFRDAQQPDSTRLEIYFGIADSSPRAAPIAPLRRGLFFFDENWNEVRQWRDERRPVNSPTADSLYLIDRWSVNMKRGTYRISLEVMETVSGRSGAERTTVLVEDFSHAQLSLSSVVLANADSANPQLALYRDNGVNLMPALSREFSVNQPLYVYYEIYNLSFDANGLSNYRIDYVVEPVQEKKSLVSRAATRFGKILGLERQSLAIGSSFESSGPRRDEKLYHHLEILGQPAGRYDLTIQLTDRVSGQSVSRRVSFAIKQKNENKD